MNLQFSKTSSISMQTSFTKIFKFRTIKGSYVWLKRITTFWKRSTFRSWSLKSCFFPSKNTFSYFRRILRTSPRSWSRCGFIDSSTTTLHSTSLWNCWLCGQQFVFTRKKQIFKVILIDFKGGFFSSFFQLIILLWKLVCTYYSVALVFRIIVLFRNYLHPVRAY